MPDFNIKASKSNYLEEKMLKFMITRSESAFVMPDTFYIGLWTTILQNSSMGSTPGEISTSGTGYERREYINNTNSWTYEPPNIMKNSNDIIYDRAQSDWGIIKSLAILDGSNNILFFSNLTTPLVVNYLNSVYIPANNLIIKET